jgi:hypothetical protein
MLAIPLNKGEIVDVTGPFHSFFVNQYGSDGVGGFVEDISEFQKARDSAVNVMESQTEAGYQTVQRMHEHLSSLVPRLTGYEGDLHFGFVWHDGFRVSKKVSFVFRTFFHLQECFT